MKEITLTNDLLKIVILPYGGIIKELWYNGVNVVLGHENSDSYLDNSWKIGACVGRYAGRLSSSFTLENKRHKLINKKGIQLHGGSAGWDQSTWKIYDLYHGSKPHLTLKHRCIEENSGGHPGTIDVSLKYSLYLNKLIIEYKAITDKACPINITNHSYFNLSGAAELNDHNLMVNSAKTLELDKKLMPTGKFKESFGTEFDRNKMRPIGKSRYDDCFILKNNTEIKASLSANSTGIQMDVLTDQPSIVVFNPKELNGICFETQKFPDGPNFPNFPNTIIKPKERYIQKTEFVFSKIKKGF